MTAAQRRAIAREIEASATHTMTAERTTVSDSSGGYEYGDPDGDGIDETTETVLSGVPVQFRDSGTDFIRASSGERIMQSPSVRAKADVADKIEEGDTVTLSPKHGDNQTVDDVEVAGVTSEKGPRGRTLAVKLELEDI